MSESNLWDALRTTVDSQVDTNKKLWGALTELTAKVQALEKRVAAKEPQDDPAEDAARYAHLSMFQSTAKELGEAALHGELQPVKYYADPRDEELEALLARHKHEIAKLKLESDRRARSVAERMLALCLAEVIGRRDISDTQMSGLRWAMDGINIEALVDESKL